MNYFFIGFGYEVFVSVFLFDSVILVKLLNDEVKYFFVVIFVIVFMDL